MSELPPFSGFPKEGLRFLAELADNNNREWFEARKQIYRDHVLGPAQALVVALGERLKLLSAAINYDTRTNGSGSLMRIYRDIRFSKDKSPYKTNVAMVFWEGAGKKTDNPGFFVSIEPTGAGVFAGQHMFPKPALAAFREAVVDQSLGAELEAALSAVREAGNYVIGGEHYKRVPRGFDADHPRADLLRYNGLYAYSPRIDSGLIMSPRLVDACFEHCQNMAPVQRWLVKLAQEMGS